MRNLPSPVGGIRSPFGQRRRAVPPGPPGPAATGGTETVITQGGKFYRVHTFLTGGTLNVTRGGDFEYLAVGGGGKGGDNGGGGGGAGGYRKSVAGEAHNTASAPLALSVGETQITVGDAAENTSIGALLEALAGGRGGSHRGDPPAAAGGCGGGGPGGTTGDGTLLNGASGSQGGDGGNGYPDNSDANRRAGGGGGGGTANGQNGAAGAGGLGGAGVATEISGTEETYCRGGDGRARGQTAVTVAAAPNTGDGGPGQNSSGSGLAGGSGIVIIRYEITEEEYLAEAA